MEKTESPAGCVGQDTGQRRSYLVIQYSIKKVDRHKNQKAIQSLYHLGSIHMDRQEGYEPQPNCKQISSGIGGCKI